MRRLASRARAYHRLPLRPPPPPLRYPPPLRPPPEPEGLASSTFSVRPSTSWPLNFLTAASASSAVAISTKPNPRERPVSRSVTTVADSTAPAWANSSRSRSLDVEKDRPPMKSFCAIAHLRTDLPRLTTLPGTRKSAPESWSGKKAVHDEPTTGPDATSVTQLRPGRRLSL